MFFSEKENLTGPVFTRRVDQMDGNYVSGQSKQIVPSVGYCWDFERDLWSLLSANHWSEGCIQVLLKLGLKNCDFFYIKNYLYKHKFLFFSINYHFPLTGHEKK